MLCGIASGGAKSMVRVTGYHDRGGIQQALDLGADGVLIPYINTAEEARQAVSCTRYPTAGTRSVYFPQRSMNKAGLLGYAGAANDNIMVALQVETASCIKNMEEIAAVPGVDILFLGQNDLCMSMGLYETYEFPHMYTSPELNAATQTLVEQAHKNNVILGLFLFGTSRVGEFLEKGFTFISVGNDLHHVLTQAAAYVKDMEGIAAEKGKAWTRRPTALMSRAKAGADGRDDTVQTSTGEQARQNNIILRSLERVSRLCERCASRFGGTLRRWCKDVFTRL